MAIIWQNQGNNSNSSNNRIISQQPIPSVFTDILYFTENGLYKDFKSQPAFKLKQIYT